MMRAHRLVGHYVRRLEQPSATKSVSATSHTLKRNLSLNNSLPYTPIRLHPPLEAALKRFRTKGGASAPDTIVDSFAKLQARKVKKVLLLCSDYDSYTFEDEGLLSEIVYHEYAQLNLRTPPVIERVAAPDAALERIRQTDFDLVVTLIRSPTSFLSAVHKLRPTLPIALMALTPAELTTLDPRVDQNQRINVNKRLMWERAPASKGAPGGLEDAWIWPFLWQGNTSLFTGLFKLVEDRLNVANDCKEGVQVILLVEDSVRFYSAYLPVLYGELYKTAAAISNETMGAKEKLMRMYSRPKVVLCTNYEEASDVFERYSDQLIGVISDAGFPRDGTHDRNAGIALARKILDERPDVPLLVQSAAGDDSDIAHQAHALGARFVSKLSPSLLQQLRSFMVDDMSFGPLNFVDGLSGKPIGRVETVTQLMHTWERLPLSSVAHHAAACDLSRWFLARAEFELARRFRASAYPADFIDSQGAERPDWLRSWILSEIRTHRNKLASGVENFKMADHDGNMPLTRLGSGSLGGKGRGFRFLHMMADRLAIDKLVPDLSISVPACFVLATGVFDRFIEDNSLLVPALSAKADEDIDLLFGEATLPEDVVEALRVYLSSMNRPIAVRSSSLFEDAFLRPFAGVYQTHMLGNASQSIDTRLDELCWAIKMVYASTYKKEARRYAESTGNRVEEEKMAVILQEVVGRHSDGHYAPDVAGVANAIDYYPPANGEPLHGCATLAFGLGGTVVDNLPAVQHFNLGIPQAGVGPADAAMPAVVLDLSSEGGGAPPSSLYAEMARGTATLTLPPSGEGLLTYPKQAFYEVAPQAVASGAAGSGRGSLLEDVHGEQVVFKEGYAGTVLGGAPPGQGRAEPPTPKRITLKQLMAEEVPLAQALSFLLRVGQQGLGTPVEIEFALKLRKSPSARHELSVLQLRPQAETQKSQKRVQRFKYLPPEEHCVVASTKALGHGTFDGITDVVYVPPDLFDPQETAEMAKEISQLNTKLKGAGRKYLLMAPGRWGSKDAQRGIPVSWNEIDGAAFIVETSVPGKTEVPLSQGSHFFQNILSFGIGYATIGARTDSEVADYAYWSSLPVSEGGRSRFAKHVTLDKPLEVFVDGTSRRAVVMKEGKSFDTHVAQVEAFLNLQDVQQSAGGY